MDIAASSRDYGAAARRYVPNKCEGGHTGPLGSSPRDERVFAMGGDDMDEIETLRRRNRELRVREAHLAAERDRLLTLVTLLEADVASQVAGLGSADSHSRPLAGGPSLPAAG